MKTLTIGLLLGAAMIASALVYHGRQLVALNERLAAVEQSNRALEHQLDHLTDDLPGLIGQGVTGVANRVVGSLFDGVRGLAGMRTGYGGAAAAGSGAAGPAPAAGGIAILHDLPETGDWADWSLSLTQGGPLVRFDIAQPIVNIDIRLPDAAAVAEALGWPEDGAPAEEEEGGVSDGPLQSGDEVEAEDLTADPSASG